MARPPPFPDVEGVHARNLGYAVATLHRLSRERLSAVLVGTGLHLGHVLLLATLYAEREREGASRLTQRRLGELTGIEKSSLVLFLDALEKDGWIERQRHPQDRRAHIIHLTDDGAKRFGAVGEKLETQQQQNLKPLTAAEQDQLLSLMNRLIAHLR
ncbi:MAG: MarR family transcriptional regulator [Caulobacteraceae bacterium]|nr:MarR family transcriptional regulator [Caulobacteraceae bacterium]